MKKIYLIDLDGVIVEQGTQILLPNALEKLKVMSQRGEIWFFSCWAFNERDLTFLCSLGIPFGIIRKPFADEYVFIDDKLKISECNVSLRDFMNG